MDNEPRHVSDTAIRKENQSMRHIFRAALFTGVLLTAVAGHAGANTRPERIVFAEEPEEELI